MGKVKLPSGVIAAIESARNLISDEDLIRLHDNRLQDYIGRFAELDRISLDELKRALDFGYELDVTDYIAQTDDNRNISYIDDEEASVWRRAKVAGMRVIRVITLEQWHLELYGPQYQVEVVAIHEQARINAEHADSIERVSA